MGHSLWLIVAKNNKRSSTLPNAPIQFEKDKIILVILLVVAVATTETAVHRISPIFFIEKNQDQLLNSRMIRDSGNWQNRLSQLNTVLNKELSV